jgi:hypothetical protein
MPLSWIVLVFKNLCNRENITTKYQIVFWREKLFDLILAVVNETHFSIHPFNLEAKGLACFFR